MSTTPIPPDVLTRTDLQHALREHDFAAAFRILKQYAGLSQTRIGLACGLTPGKVSTIISGTAQITSYEVLCRVADGLRIPGDLIGLAPRPWETAEAPARAATTSETPIHMDTPGRLRRR